MMITKQWIRMVSLVLALCMALSLNLNVMAAAVDEEIPGASTPVTPQEPETSETTEGTQVPPVPSTPVQPETPAPSVPAYPVDTPPVLEHTPITSIMDGEDIVFEVIAYDDIAIFDVLLHYRAAGSVIWEEPRVFEYIDGDLFRCTMASDEIFDVGMEYYIEATDGLNTVQSGSRANPHVFYYGHNFSISGVLPEMVDVNALQTGVSAVLIGTNFVEGMILSVGGTAVHYTLNSSTMLTFMMPLHKIGTADISLTYNNSSVKIEDAVSYYDSRSSLEFRQEADVDGGTQLRIPLWASASEDIFTILASLQLDLSLLSNVRFELDDYNSYAVARFAITPSGVLTVSIESQAALNTAQPIGYLVADTVIPDGNKDIHISFRTATFNEADVGVPKELSFKLLDKEAPVIIIHPYDTTPTNRPVTVYASASGGSLNRGSHTFTKNGSFLFIATDEAGNTTTKEVVISNIYQNYTLSLINVPDNFLVVEGAVPNVSGWMIQINYDSGVAPVTIPVTADMVMIPSYSVGKSQGFVTYEDLSVPFDYEVISNENAQLNITSLPFKTEYLPGEALDLTGLSLNFTCGEDYAIVLTEGQYSVLGYDPERNGLQEITILYGEYSATFTVRVKSLIPDQITSTVYKIENGFLSGVSVGTTMDVLLEEIPEAEFVRITDNGLEISIDDLLCTGMVIELMDGDIVKQSLTIIVAGDVNGDGSITISDMISVKGHLLGNKTLEGSAAMAADYNGDGSITISDFVWLKSYILNDGDAT